jgi:hypothetical protein
MVRDETGALVPKELSKQQWTTEVLDPLIERLDPSAMVTAAEKKMIASLAMQASPNNPFFDMPTLMQKVYNRVYYSRHVPATHKSKVAAQQTVGIRQSTRIQKRKSAVPQQKTTGAAERKTGPAERKTGPAERKRGPAKRKTGPAKRKTGPAKRKTGPAKRKTGAAKRKNGPANPKEPEPMAFEHNTDEDDDQWLAEALQRMHTGKVSDDCDVELRKVEFGTPEKDMFEDIPLALPPVVPHTCGSDCSAARDIFCSVEDVVEMYK